ncbi:carboxypeptidase-like regulatory domain-containing protein [Cesiribacter andamanensis]|uniref:TonB-linked outer membrane protein, SusC/RagA family n=1 Tax=Cesiribacter andamanensis AMV16 TaxID=1279009 RepID=M7N281_9BACT|nr:carboxypeptidase-like regulatory domain-containing protein [Cesiribacter andamanensis]EMR01311.1 TonB-linked outer membrane protein, SusC/RagA family [Cesiribacter andamanensis AMV16]
MKVLFTAILSLFYSAVLAQSTTITGTVSSSDGKPAEFVNVYNKGTTIGTATDQRGYFVILNAPLGPQTLVASFVGIQPVEKAILLQEGENQDVNLSLLESATALGEVVVMGQQRRTSTVTKTLTPLETSPSPSRLLTKS